MLTFYGGVKAWHERKRNVVGNALPAISCRITRGIISQNRSCLARVPYALSATVSLLYLPRRTHRDAHGNVRAWCAAVTACARARQTVSAWRQRRGKGGSIKRQQMAAASVAAIGISVISIIDHQNVK